MTRPCACGTLNLTLMAPRTETMVHGAMSCGPVAVEPIVELEEARAQLARIEALCASWDQLTKGPSPTSVAIRAARDGDER